jgi:hypothetical protein
VTADLVAFLRARLDEDEQYARGPWGDSGYSEYNEPGAPGHHERVLAEVDAKRRIIAASPVACPPGCARDHTFSGSCALRWMGPVVWGEDDSPWVHDSDGATVLAPPVTTNYVLRLLALPYRDHPDYQPTWAPKG